MSREYGLYDEARRRAFLNNTIGPYSWSLSYITTLIHQSAKLRAADIHKWMHPR